VRALAARCLALSSGRRPDDVALLRKSLTDEFITVRCAAIRALVTIDPDDPQTAADLRSLASDASEFVRLTAERLSAH
jgi:HEAT repeat protein